MKGTPKQIEAFKHLTDSTTKELLYGGAAGGGKSFLGCFWLIIVCKAYPNTRYFIAREELKRIRQSTLVTFSKVAKLLGVNDYHINNHDNYIEFNNGSRIDLLDIRYLPSDPIYERFGSIEYTGGWIEEGGETNVKAYEVIKTRIGRHLNEEYSLIGKLLITCNPKKNWLYTYFYKPFRKGILEQGKEFVQALIQDNPHISKDYIESLRKIKDKALKERLLKGNWEYSDDPNALCKYEDIVSIFTNDHINSEASHYITADIARLGSDKAVLMAWKGWQVVEVVTFDKSRLTELETTISAMRSKYNVPAKNTIADEDGVGGGVVDHLGIKGFMNNSRPVKMVHEGKSIHENYQNLQTQCGYLLAEKINEYKLYISAELSQDERELIIEELEQLKSYKTDNEGKLRLLPKADIKDNIGRSPDYRDALLMRVYFELNPYSGRYAVG